MATTAAVAKVCLLSVPQTLTKSHINASERSPLCLNPQTQRPWHEYEHNFQIMYKVGMGHKPQIPEKLSTEGKDFLGHCLESEPKRRWTASMLLDHTFVKVRDAADFRSRRIFHSSKASNIEAAVFSPAGVYRRRVNRPSDESFQVYKWKHYCTRCRRETNNLWTLGGKKKRERLKAHGLKLRNT